MNKRLMTIATFCLGMAAGPLAYHLGDMMFQSAEAQDPVIVLETTPAIVLETTAIVLEATPTVDQAKTPSETHVMTRVMAPSCCSQNSRVEEQAKLHSVYGFRGSPPRMTFTLNGGLPILQLGQVITAGSGSGPTAGTVTFADPEKIFGGTSANGFNGFTVGITGSPAVMPSGGISFTSSSSYTDAPSANCVHFCTIDGVVLNANSVQLCTELSGPDISTQFVELSKELTKMKLKRLSPQELAHEVETLKQEVSNFEAIRKLEEAQQQLKKIVSEHPESPAAQRAKRMLGVEQVILGQPVYQANPVPLLHNAFPTY